MIFVERFVNKPVASCTYVVYDNEISGDCLIVDPGSEDLTALLSFLSYSKLSPSYIFLTHEHFDHCMGVNLLRELYPDSKLVCSRECNEAIQDEKKNCSVFWDNQKSFVVKPAEIITEDINDQLNWNDLKIEIISSPGHTKGSICILIDKCLFTGDAYIPGIKTVTKLPGGNKEDAICSEEKIIEIIIKNKVDIYAGH